MTNRKQRIVMRLRITLSGIDPAVWRIIDVPESYSFWDLHVAIQDAMGWFDAHLHMFIPETSRRRAGAPIGIPDEEFGDGTVASWEVPISTHLVRPGDQIGYEYDFGDSWHHQIELVDIHVWQPRQKYPCCVDGARACPPEDCGGVPGYYRLLEILSDPSHEEHDEIVQWLGGDATHSAPYDPDAFDPARVHFDSPKTRFKFAFGPI